MPRKKTNLESTEPISELSAATENLEQKKKRRAPAKRRSPRPSNAEPSEISTTQTFEIDEDESVTVAFRSRAKASTPEPAPVAKAEPRTAKGRGATKSKPAAAPAPVEEGIFEAQRDENDLPIPRWRSIQARAAETEAEQAIDEKPVKKERGRGKRKTTKDSEEVRDVETSDEDLPKTVFRKRGKAEAEPVAVRKPVRPKPEPKALIPTPPDAPQVVLRDGIPILVRNGQVYPPIAFFGNCSDEKRSETVFEEIRLAAESGVHLYSLLVDLEVNHAAVDHAVSFAAYLAAQVTRIDPAAQILMRVVFVAPRGWEREYPDARYVGLNGQASEPSLCDKKYWTVAKECLESFVKQLRMLELRENILGVHLERGEWFVPLDGGYDDSTAAKAGFKDWTRTRYSEDEVALRASWFDGSINFDNVQIPPYQPEGAEGDRFVRSSRKQRRYVDYHLFLSDATVERIADLAYAAKVASGGYFLVGASYGYTFEWAHPSSGHLAAGTLCFAAAVAIRARVSDLGRSGISGSAWSSSLFAAVTTLAGEDAECGKTNRRCSSACRMLGCSESVAESVEIRWDCSATM